MSGATLIAAYFIVAVGFAGRENTIPNVLPPPFFPGNASNVTNATRI
jgi:hypothetical protein